VALLIAENFLFSVSEMEINQSQRATEKLDPDFANPEFNSSLGRKRLGASARCPARSYNRFFLLQAGITSRKLP